MDERHVFAYWANKKIKLDDLAWLIASSSFPLVDIHEGKIRIRTGHLPLERWRDAFVFLGFDVIYERMDMISGFEYFREKKYILPGQKYERIPPIYAIGSGTMGNYYFLKGTLPE